MAQKDSSSVGVGIRLVCLGHMIYLMLVVILSFPLALLLQQLNLVSVDSYFLFTLWVWGFWAMGLIQFVYVIPLFYVQQRQRNRSHVVDGIIIAASITLLLSGSCYSMSA